MKHVPIHLKLDPKRDTDAYPRKRGTIYVLKKEHGGSYCGSTLPNALCGPTARSAWWDGASGSA